MDTDQPERDMDTRWNWRANYRAWETNSKDSEEWNAMNPEQQAARIAGTDRENGNPSSDMLPTDTA